MGMPPSLEVNTSPILDVIFLAHLVCYLWIRKPAGSSAAAQWNMGTREFSEWLDSVLSRTQTSEPIQLLALHILFRLIKKSGINGLPGSEYRMLLCCLALANKSLEDNTYTAKTWSDVAGLSTEAINFGEREILRALDWKIQPSNIDEWNDFRDRVERWRWKRQEALSSPTTSTSSPVIFDPSYSMNGSPFLATGMRSRSQPGSPLRVAVDHPREGHYGRKRKADEADLVVAPGPPAPAMRRASAGALAQQSQPHPRSTTLFQTALQQGYLRSASLSPISSYGPFSPTSAFSASSTPYNTPPMVFSPITYGYLERRLPLATPAQMGAPIYTTQLMTDPVTGRITTQLVAVPGFNNVINSNLTSIASPVVNAGLY